MTDEQIIKTLEYCSNVNAPCDDCPCHETGECISTTSYVLDLINRQQAEIERLQIRLKKERHQFEDVAKMYDVIKAEAIKEFAEQVKTKEFCFGSLRGVELVTIYAVETKDIDNLVKEME